MSDFDPIKALREEIAGLVEIGHALSKRERSLQIIFNQTESELEAVTKLRGYCLAELASKRQRLQQLEADRGRHEA